MKRFYLFFITILIFSLFIYFIIKNRRIIFEKFVNNNNDISIILIGDSILNNSNYIKNNEKSVFQHLTNIINNKYINYNRKINIYNYAQDGATINDCFRQVDNIQLNKLDENNNINNYSNLYIVLSCGGNNILKFNNIDNFSELNQLESKLTTLIKTIQIKFPLVNIFILNLYYPFNSKFASYKENIKQWNNKINDLCKINLNNCKVVDISSKITSVSDLIYDIEPSSTGGEKIANIIASNL